MTARSHTSTQGLLTCTKKRDSGRHDHRRRRGCLDTARGQDNELMGAARCKCGFCMANALQEQCLQMPRERLLWQVSALRVARSDVQHKQPCRHRLRQHESCFSVRVTASRPRAARPKKNVAIPLAGLGKARLVQNVPKDEQHSACKRNAAPKHVPVVVRSGKPIRESTTHTT